MAALTQTAIVGVVGAGAMGGGIAQVALVAGHPVLLYDINETAARKAADAIAERLNRSVEKGRMAPAARDAALARLSVVGTLEALAPAALVIEAAAERLDVKQAIFRALEAACGADAILASNTSSLSITAIGAALQRPQRLAGMHFFNPAPVLPPVEVVSGLATDPQVAQTIFDTAAAWGKSPVHARSTPGFIVNRVARPFYGEALRLFEERAADPATIDALMREAGGFPMGPFELTDLIGQDVNYAVTCSVFEAFHGDPRYKPSLAQKALVEAGRLGRKTGQGFYSYAEGAERPAPATAAAKPAPERVTVVGELGPAAALTEALENSAIAVERRAAEAGPGYLELAGGARLMLSDGGLATARAAALGVPVVHFDLALDYAKATRIALAPCDGCPAAVLDAAVGLFQALGKAVSVIDDVPGMVVLRTVAMLANEAADAVHQGVADAAGVDLAMRQGVNYPQGPLAWADAVGPARLLAVIETLAGVYGDGRYRPSPLLRRKALTGGCFR